MYAIAITETQFISCLQLIRTRLKLINERINNNIQKMSVTSEPNNKDGKTLDAYRFNYYANEFCGRKNATKYAKCVSKNINQNNDDNNYRIRSKSIIRTLNGKTTKNTQIVPIAFASSGTYLNHDDEYSGEINQFHRIYTMLKSVMAVINSAFSLHFIIILITKFTTLTSLLYFCSMIIIKWVSFYSPPHSFYSTCRSLIKLTMGNYRLISGDALTSENIDQLLSSWAWICGLSIEILILCYSCNLTTDESKLIGCNLHRFVHGVKSVRCKIAVHIGIPFPPHEFNYWIVRN